MRSYSHKMNGNISSGLEGVVAAETILSDVDGTNGRLIIRGCDLAEIAGSLRFESVVELLFTGFFEEMPVDAALSRALGDARVDVFGLIDRVDPGLLERSDFDAMRALIARLPDGDDVVTALRLVAAPAVFTPALIRARRGLAPRPPDPRRAHSADVLAMMHDDPVESSHAAALDTYFVTVADHGLNASTFAARVVASTRAGLTSAVLAGLSALKGPLHGGAPGPVIEMLDEIGTPQNARPWLESALARGERLMGFGHRVYRVRDPRADALKSAVRALMSRSGDGFGRLELAEQVEAAALAILREHKPNRSLETNVEFYTALLLEGLGFPPSAFTSVFAMGRVAGWIAHAREQVATGRLIRPQSRYVGPMPQSAA